MVEASLVYVVCSMLARNAKQDCLLILRLGRQGQVYK